MSKTTAVIARFRSMKFLRPPPVSRRAGIVTSTGHRAISRILRSGLRHVSGENNLDETLRHPP
jgi:hypothetical protein